MSEELPNGSLDRIKDLVPLIAVAGALLYGLGWIMEALASSMLGAASIRASRENALAAALFFTGGPALTMVPVFKKPYSKVHLRDGALFAFGGVILPATIAQMLSGFSSMRSSFILALGAVAVSLFAMYVPLALAAPRYAARSGLPISSVKFITGFGQGLFSTVLYGSILLPWFPASMGGFDVRETVLTIKSEEDKGKPTRIPAYLIDMDDKSAVFAVRDQADLTHRFLPELKRTALRRIPADRLLLVEFP